LEDKTSSVVYNGLSVGKTAPGGQRFFAERKAAILEEENIYNSVVCYLQTLPMKLLDLQHAVKIKAEEIYNLGMDR
jgi:hypothetical protein